jgi:acetyl esterase/lipase
VLYLHGGAYVMGHPRGYRALTGELGRAAGAPTLSIDYRLAPEHLFPAAVVDALQAYRALLKDFAPHQIAIAGDSAGGGLAAAMLLAARDAELPLPAASCLLSPWLDLTCSSASMATRAERDLVLTPSRLKKRAKTYLGDQVPINPLASPLFGDLTGLPPMLIQVGEGEVLLDEAIAFADKASHAGVRVMRDVWPEMIHVWHRFAAQLDEARVAIEDAGHFLRRALDAASAAAPEAGSARA